MRGSDSQARGVDGRLAEAIGLASAIDLDVIDAIAVTLSTLRPATYLGSGKVDELGGLLAALEVDVVIVDTALSPGQQRNLEKAWKTKVIDRTGLILEIFGARARTAEGRLQVELAQLDYQKSRLVRSWTHLERQRGGAGFMGGPGETQIEADRRLISDRIVKLKRELEDVRRTRELHRAGRRKVPYPIVALVGYTNAGKSTLFNLLTKAGVLSADMLFATLDPTLRELTLPSGAKVVLSDTVGFISSLPTQLIAAFRATLEEVLEAQVIIHVRDISHDETEAQARDVEGVLADLGVEQSRIAGDIQVLNKMDRLDDDARLALLHQAARHDTLVPVSAVDGTGVDHLLARIESALKAERVQRVIDIAPSDGKLLAWVYRHGNVVARQDDEDGSVHLTVSLSPADMARFEKIQLAGSA
jgi:GTP-binding protein HflX